MQILNFVGRGTSLRDYQRLKAALDPPAIDDRRDVNPSADRGRRHRFSWINEWQERTDRNGRPDGIELIVPDWFYKAVLDDALVLTIDPAYFDLTGGLDRWLYRVVRKHGGRQRDGWRFDLRHLHLKSGSLVAVQTLRLRTARHRAAPTAARLRPLTRGWKSADCTLLAFEPLAACGKRCGNDRAIGNPHYRAIGNPKGSCYREPKPRLSYGNHARNRAS